MESIIWHHFSVTFGTSSLSLSLLNRSGCSAFLAAAALACSDALEILIFLTASFASTSLPCFLLSSFPASIYSLIEQFGSMLEVDLISSLSLIISTCS